jgi:homogentisate phytyltransferase/homogentisate geranylgeranyltransferase
MQGRGKQRAGLPGRALVLLLLPLAADAWSARLAAPRLGASRRTPTARAPDARACTTLGPDGAVGQVDEAVDVSLPARPVGPLRAASLLWRFSRPHTLIGSALCIPALSLLAAPAGIPAGAMASALLPVVAYATLPSLLINIYITGLNQLFDVDIDKASAPPRFFLFLFQYFLKLAL